jgi:fructoselysine-6-P-deglycase FrlB-like protein
MPARPDWYNATYPEWREGPPWVMEDMVAAQAGLPEALSSVASEAAPLLDALRGAAARGEPIVTAACGTSEHASQALALILSDALGATVEARQSLEQTLEPRSQGVCLAVSHGGLSKATVSALEAARRHGAVTALITAAADAPTHPSADLILRTPVRDRSMCHTVGYTSPIFAGLLLASLARGEDFPQAALEAQMAGLLQLQAAASACTQGLAGIERLIAAGSGIDQPAARELALKVAEGARVPTSFVDLENVLHGHLVAHDSDSALIVFVTDQHASHERAQRAGDVLTAAREIGLHTVAVLSEAIADVVGVGATQVLLVPSFPGVPNLANSLLGGAIALQTLTIGLVHEKMTNPDLLRREEAPYREAVAVGNTKFPRPLS